MNELTDKEKLVLALEVISILGSWNTELLDILDSEEIKMSRGAYLRVQELISRKKTIQQMEWLEKTFEKIH